jgi:hypothetical protein
MKHKANYKRKVVRERDDGELTAVKQKQRNPIVSLPDITATPIYMRYIRYITASQITTGQLNVNNLLDQFMVQVSTALGVCYVKALRIKAIRFLAPVTTQGTSVTLKITPVGVDSSANNYNSVPETYMDTSSSIDIPAYIKLKPSLSTPLGSWHYSNSVSSAVMLVTCPAGTTMDILYEFILNSEFGASSYTNTLVTGTVGDMYSRNIITNFVPQVANLR